ncbi:hypothetical protein C6169_04795 [Salmonella enterica]|nr:hypothetical protein [Salmonella enterica]EBV5771745.1 hypothetical protein [Salmonella enterica subsp. enterica serovar Monophasic]ECS7594092.1 hypothetical protein [Salmonella enterica subsp. enterica serovar Norwich]EAP0850474.1 hypothetical protein [Salmonella enterica]EAP1745572.1 hypothetical protein [Salmonella enterica]
MIDRFLSHKKTILDGNTLFVYLVEKSMVTISIATIKNNFSDVVIQQGFIKKKPLIKITSNR